MVDPKHRQRNNAAARRSRLKAKAERADPLWIGTRITLKEAIAVTRFLDGSNRRLPADVRAELRKHLTAKQTVENDRVRVLIKRLDVMEEK